MKTYNGKECIAIRTDSEIGREVLNEANPRGSYQKLVVERLLDNGFIVSYLASGHPLRGKAMRYKGRYEKSLHNVMRRVGAALPPQYELKRGPCGEKGGYGYWVANRSLNVFHEKEA